MSTDFFPRATCATCGRPEVVCYCRFVTKLATKTRVLILQHPREEKVAINTARIAALCLENAELSVGVQWKDMKALSDPERPAALLYPGAGAIDVSVSPPKGPITLVVVDGTWWQAKKLVRSNPELAALPRYAFQPPSPSDYRIRREPHEDYVSTVEALVHVLSVLEDDPEKFLAMLTPFRAMVDAQLAFVGKNSRPRHARARAKRAAVDPRSRLPIELTTRFEDLVCIHAEANAWPYNSKERTEHTDEVVQWVACRPSTGEVFDAIVAPNGELAPSTTRHTEIDADTFSRGISNDELVSRFAAFSRPNDVFCGWGTYSLTLFKKAGGSLPETRLDLRIAAREFLKASVGTMSAFRAHFGMAQPPSIASGRAGRRIAELAAVVRFLAHPLPEPAAQLRIGSGDA
ncbi:MAG: tRNA-uridine aminocarboxypropyltransferase [Polyangiaceae bacterium]